MVGWKLRYKGAGFEKRSRRHDERKESRMPKRSISSFSLQQDTSSEHCSVDGQYLHTFPRLDHITYQPKAHT